MAIVRADGRVPVTNREVSDEEDEDNDDMNSVSQAFIRLIVF